MTQEALNLALDLATMHHTDAGYSELRSKVRQFAKEALAQPQQEPVYKYCTDGKVIFTNPEILSRRSNKE